MKKIILPLTLGLLLTVAVGAAISLAGDVPTAPPKTLNSGHHFLPPYPNPRDRFGFDSDKSDPLTGYDVTALHAGWYSDWGTSLNPAHPDKLAYVQLIRVHAGSDPYDPAQVQVSPGKATIAQIATANPGSLWLVGNEPDSLYQGEPIYPEVYAHVYYDLYTYIKGVDSSALIANGGIVQPTPCRIEYLDIVWDTYQQAYGQPMPVDVWNIHAFVLREVYGSWGASTPPGVNPSCGMDYAIRDGDDIDLFRENLVAFRQWMKDKGEQNKPLVISEYGVLWPDWLVDEDGYGFPPVRVSHFMTQTFDLFLDETFPDVGYPEDGHRLVQAWAWYSLSDDSHYNGYLFHKSSKQISPMGQTYAAYSAALPDPQYSDLSVGLWVDLDPLENLPPTTPYDGLTVTVPVEGAVANLGKLPATGVVIASPLLSFQSTQDIPARYEGDVPLLSLPSLVLTQPGLHNLSLVADPAGTTGDPRRWNNGVTITVDARPDLVLSAASSDVQLPGGSGDPLTVAFSVANAGTWPASPVSGTLYLKDAQGSLLLPGQRFPVPAIGPGAQVNLVEEVPLPTPNGDLYRLALEVDSDGALEEQDEDNNKVEVTLSVVVTAMLQPDTTSVLTSTSDHLTFLFPTGTVTTPTEIRFTSLWTGDLPPGPPLAVAAFRLAAYRGSQLVTPTLLQPIVVTWRYTDEDVSGLNEDDLGLYFLMEADHWQPVDCPTEQHQPEANRLSTCLQQVGVYVFGLGYEAYLPVIRADSAASHLRVPAPSPSPERLQDASFGLPLRLPPVGPSGRPAIP